MLKIITLICALIALLTSAVTESWLRSRRGSGEDTGKLYGILKYRNSGFRRFQIPYVIASVLVLGVILGVGTGWTRAAVFAIGALILCASELTGAASSVSGGTAGYSAAMSGDIRMSLKAAFRSGDTMGFLISGMGLIVLGMLFILFKPEKAGDLSCCLALGASVSALFLNVGGSIYSSSYSLAIGKDDFRDISGSFTGSGADLAESYIISAAAVMMLAENGVNTSGVTSTFTQAAAAKFPLLLYGVGIVACVIGCLMFRGSARAPYEKGALSVPLVSSIIVVAVSVYFSISLLQSRVYAYCVAAGLAAGGLLGLFSLVFSYDSRLMIGGLKRDRKLGSHAPVIFNEAYGMISTAVYACAIVAVLFVSYMFAGLYGMALSAAGLCTIIAAVSAFSGVGIVSSAVSSMITAKDAPEELYTVSDAIETASSRLDTAAASYSAVMSSLASITMFVACAYTAGFTSLNILSPKIFAGAICGVAAAFLLLGLIVVSVRVTAGVALVNIGEENADDTAGGLLRGSGIPAVAAVLMPAVIGVLLGTDVLCAFLGGAVITGSMLLIARCNSGQYLRDSASRSLGTVIKLMAVFSAAFLPAFIRAGGIFF